ncbi:MAG TPA: CHRD domain-containing protein [Candidatus Dormibacteraeota bacterium]|nr:CHRD domain-containing protein [Candidatus Dormibacteraeota bacterium]
MRLVWAGRMLAVIALLGLSVSVVTTSADEGKVSARATLSGFQENLPKLTDGTGSFSATVSSGTLSYKLTFSGLTSPAFMSHIHFGQPGVNGGVFIWLCGSAAAPGPAGTKTCPANGGTVTGTVTAADVQSILGTPPPPPSAANQNVHAGDFAGAVRILRSGDAYVNVHTTNFPGGEIRGQVTTSSNDSSNND